jgi:hypothetical protein
LFFRGDDNFLLLLLAAKSMPSILLASLCCERKNENKGIFNERAEGSLPWLPMCYFLEALLGLHCWILFCFGFCLLLSTFSNKNEGFKMNV